MHEKEIRCTDYELFVLKGLVGIFGNTVDEIIEALLSFWFRDNREMLKEYGLGVQDWQKLS